MKQYLDKSAHRLTEAEKAEIWQQIDPSRARSIRPRWRWAPGLAIAGAACAVLAIAYFAVPRGRGPLPEGERLAAAPTAPEPGVTVAPPGVRRETAAKAAPPETAPSGTRGLAPAEAPTAPTAGPAGAAASALVEAPAEARGEAPVVAMADRAGQPEAGRLAAGAPASAPVQAPTTSLSAAPTTNAPGVAATATSRTADLAQAPAAAPVAAPSGRMRGVLEGRVLDRETGQPLPLAEVSLAQGGPEVSTADDGRFVLTGLEPGRPTELRIEYLGFAPVETTVTLAAGDTLALAFALTPVIVATTEAFDVQGRRHDVDVKGAGPAARPGQERITRYAIDSVADAADKQARAARERTGAAAPSGQPSAPSGEKAADRAGPRALPDVPTTSDLSQGWGVSGVPAGTASPAPARGGRPQENRMELPPAAWHDIEGVDEAAWRRRCWIPPDDRGFDAMTFRHSGVNPFVLTDRDALATFGLDVDNASFTITREYLERGALPPAGAVRLEEFVNSFDQGYPAVRDGDFQISVDGAPSPFGRGYHLLRVGLRARDVREGPRRPANLVFVVDVSGSMAREDRLELVKKALHLLLDELDPRDTVGIVAFTTDARVVLESTGVSHRRTIEAAIADLAPENTTNVEAGLELGYRMARAHFRPGGVNRILLCSDGVANVASTRAEDILDHVRRESDGGIQLSAVGVGMGNYNDVLMEKLADRGDGNYYYVDRLEEARRIFRENLTGTLRTIAEDARVQVEFDPAVVSRWRLLGYENRRLDDQDFRNDAVDAGEVGAGHQVTALFEVKLTGGDRWDDETGWDGPAWDEDGWERAVRRRGGEPALATVRLRYRQPGAAREDDFEVRGRDGRGEAEGDWLEVQRRVTARDLSRTFTAASPRLRLDAVVAEFAEILRGSYWARGSRLAELARPAREVARALPHDRQAREFAQMVTLAAQIEAQRGGRAVWDEEE